MLESKKVGLNLYYSYDDTGALVPRKAMIVYEVKDSDHHMGRRKEDQVNVALKITDTPIIIDGKADNAIKGELEKKEIV